MKIDSFEHPNSHTIVTELMPGVLQQEVFDKGTALGDERLRLISEAYPSPVSLVKSDWGPAGYHFRADWELPKALRDSHYTNMREALSAARVHLTPEKIATNKPQKAGNPEGPSPIGYKPTPPAGLVLFDVEDRGPLHIEHYTLEGKPKQAVITSPDLEGVVLTATRDPELPFWELSASKGKLPPSLQGRFTNIPELAERINKALNYSQF